jgi:hypothetical protein
MTVITMSRTEIDRMSVLRDLADGRIKAADASTLMGLGRRQVFRLAKAYGQQGPKALVPRRRGRPSNRSYPCAWGAEVLGINVFDTHGDLFQSFVQINSFDSESLRPTSSASLSADAARTSAIPKTAPPLKGYRCPDQRKPVESQGTQAMMMTATKRANM